MVRELADELLARGVRPWMDERELVPGRPWQDAVEEIIQTTRSAAVLFGPSGLGPWEEPEMRACLTEFVERELPVIPVLLPGAPSKPKLPLFLKAFTWVDLREGLTDDGLRRLVWGITGIRPEDQSAPTPVGVGPATPSHAPQALARSGPVELSVARRNELTSLANQHIAEGAQAWLDQECAPFVVPSLARHVLDEAHRALSSPSRRRVPLEADEIESLTLGNLPPQSRRVRIIGDSGMGKTALLHYCEFRIATANEPRLPMRIDGLVGCNWSLHHDEVLAWLLERVLHVHLPSGVSAD